MYNTNGLKEDEVKESRKRYGSNSINEKNKNVVNTNNSYIPNRMFRNTKMYNRNK